MTKSSHAQTDGTDHDNNAFLPLEYEVNKTVFGCDVFFVRRSIILAHGVIQAFGSLPVALLFYYSDMASLAMQPLSVLTEDILGNMLTRTPVV